MANGYLFDLHCHTRDHSHDGRVPAVDLLRALVAGGFAGVTFTDHNYVWPDEEVAALRASAALPADFVLLSGQEVRVSDRDLTLGDLLVYGPAESLPDGTPIREVLELARQAGGFCIAAHPGIARKGLGDHVGSYPLLAIETWNGRYGRRVARESQALAERFHLVGVGGSDAHRPEDIGGGGTMFDHLPRTLPEVAEAIRSGAARPWEPGLLQGLRRYFSG